MKRIKGIGVRSLGEACGLSLEGRVRLRKVEKGETWGYKESPGKSRISRIRHFISSFIHSLIVKSFWVGRCLTGFGRHGGMPVLLCLGLTCVSEADQLSC